MTPNEPEPTNASQPAPVPDPAIPKIGALAIATADDEQLLEPGEHLVTVVRRHPIGLVAIYVEMLAGIAAVIAMLLYGILVFFKNNSGSAKGLAAAGAVFVIAFIILLLIISTLVYRRCRLIVTDKSVVQIIQKALFNRKISRLSMSNVEDVNVEQKGILASLFNYGTLTIQTAGQEDNFVFSLCPKPNDLADRILQARQRYAQSLEEGNERLIAIAKASS